MLFITKNDFVISFKILSHTSSSLLLIITESFAIVWFTLVSGGTYLGVLGAF